MDIHFNTGYSSTSIKHKKNVEDHPPNQQVIHENLTLRLHVDSRLNIVTKNHLLIDFMMKMIPYSKRRSFKDKY